MLTSAHQATLAQLPDLVAELESHLRDPHTGRARGVREFLAQELQRECAVFTLAELCELSRGKHLTQAQIAQQRGSYPIYSSATQDEGVIGYVDFFHHEGDALTWTTDGIYAGTVFQRTGRFALTVHCGLIVRRAEFATLLDYAYLRFYLQYALRQLVNTSTRQPMLGLETMRKLKVVVPSLKVQRLLGVFFNIGVANAASLDAELELRQIQLSYYRHLLLDPHAQASIQARQLLLQQQSMHARQQQFTPTSSMHAESVTYLPLAQLASLRIGDLSLTQEYIAAHRGVYPVYSAQTSRSGICGYIDSYQQDGEYLTWSLVGYAGRFFYRQGKFNAGSMCGLLQVTQPEIVYCKYLYQVLQLQAPRSLNSSSVMPMCNIKHLQKLRIPLLPYPEQVAVGDLLTDCETYLTGELASLARQRELRQAQLDYYLAHFFNLVCSHATSQP